MGRKALFTQEQVFETADKLAESGKEVSAKNLLAALGGGSLTKIYQHLAAWQECRPVIASVQSSLDIPEAVQNAFANTWRVAVTEATKEIIAAREKAGEEVRAAHKKFHDALELVERLENEAEADADQIECITAKLTQLEATLHKQESELAVERTRTAQLRESAMSQNAELQRLRSERDTVASEVGQLRGKNDALREQALVDATQIETLTGKLSELESALHRLGSELAVERTRTAQMQDSAKSHEMELERLRAERNAAADEAALLRGHNEALKEQTGYLLNRLPTLAPNP